MQAMTACGQRERGTRVGLRRLRPLALVLVCGALPCALPATAQTRGPQSVAPVAEGLIEAVVNISTSQAIKGPQGLPLPSVPKGSPYHEYFDEFFDNRNGRSGSGPHGVLARLRLYRRRQARHHRHQQPRDRWRRGNPDQPARRLEAQSGAARQGHQDRHRAVEGDAESAAEGGEVRLLRGHPRRRLGDGYRQPVRPRRQRHSGHHFGQGAQHQFRALRRLPADRRLDQQGQLGRSAVQHGWRGRRREHGDHLANRRLDRHRLCGAGRHGGAGRAAAAPVS